MFQIRRGSKPHLQRGVQVFGGGDAWESYSPVSSAVCNAAIPTFPLFEMAESACSPFCHVLHNLLFIKFISALYHLCVIEQCCSTVEVQHIFN
jgi:hypothetical protein